MNREDREDQLHLMRQARDVAEAVCEGSDYTPQDWDDLQHLRAEVLRLEAQLRPRT